MSDKMRQALRIARNALLDYGDERHIAPAVEAIESALAEQPAQGEAVADAERRAILWERLHDKRVEQLRERNAEIAKLTAPPAPAVPDGWQIERRSDGSILVQADGIGCAAVHQFADQARQIPEEMLWNLCNAMLSANSEPRP